MSRPLMNSGLGLAQNENRVGLGLSANPTLPPGVGFGSGMPHANLNGMAENTGNPAGAAIAALIKGMGNAGGMAPKGGGSRGPRGVEKPSNARSGAISRRLNGAPSRGTELKGL